MVSGSGSGSVVVVAAVEVVVDELVGAVVVVVVWGGADCSLASPHPVTANRAPTSPTRHTTLPNRDEDEAATCPTEITGGMSRLLPGQVALTHPGTRPRCHAFPRTARAARLPRIRSPGRSLAEGQSG